MKTPVTIHCDDELKAEAERLGVDFALALELGLKERIRSERILESLSDDDVDEDARDSD